MSVHLKPEDLAQMKNVINMFMACPQLLHKPELSFVKLFIEHFGGKVPTPEKSETKNVSKESESGPKPEPKSQPEPQSKTEIESDESDLELDMTGVIEPDTDAPQVMGDLTLQPTEEVIEETKIKRAEALSAFLEKDYDKAIDIYTQAIVMNPQASLLYAKRGQIYLLLNKPNACIRDCDRALELNPDSAIAHKFRGRAWQLLGKFDKAAHDLRLACRYDFDEEADEWLRAVTPNARKIEEHKRKKERKQQEKQENVQDREMYDFFKEITANPAALLKDLNNPKLMAFLNKMSNQSGVFPEVPTQTTTGKTPNSRSTDGTAPPATEQYDDGLD